MTILATWFPGESVFQEAVKQGGQVALAYVIKTAIPSMILLTCMVSVLVALYGAWKVVDRFFDLGRDILRDDKITGPEWVLAALYAMFVACLAGALLHFAYFMLAASKSGLTELMR